MMRFNRIERMYREVPSIVDGESSYEEYQIQKFQSEILMDKWWYDGSFSCIQEISCNFGYIDVCNLELYILTKIHVSAGMYNCWMIADDLTVWWLGFCEYPQLMLLKTHGLYRHNEWYDNLARRRNLTEA